jgi:Holliday junction resolvasome RuvABC endonuclease subunit
MKIRVVGLDPSMSIFGIAKATLDTDSMTFTLDDLVLVKTEPEHDKRARKVVRKNSEDLERARLLHKGIIEHTKNAALAFAEVPVGSQSARAMASYGMCLGILAACPIPLIQVTPTEVKLAGAGIKTASKEEMIAWALKKYPDANWLRYQQSGKSFKKGDPCSAIEHLADATAAIEAGILTDQFRQMVAMMSQLRLAA